LYDPYGSDEAEIQVSLADRTLGCRICDNYDTYNSTSIVEYNYEQGYYYQSCDNLTEYENITAENQPCIPYAILQWEGIIESEKTLECIQCSNIIPNCVTCSSNSSCSICDTGFHNVDVYDTFGNLNNVCLKQFCGLPGKDSGCATV
jgi:hypothetical protein